MKLNKIERLKQELAPIEYYKQLNSLKEEDLTEEDLFYLKNFGIYGVKTKPGFMLRIRVPAGRIEYSQIRKILSLVRETGARILLTARAQMELHDLTLDQAIWIHKELKETGVTTFGTLVDNFRNIVTDPYDGASTECEIEAWPIIQKMQEIILQPTLLGMLPRKFNTAVVGVAQSTQSFFSNDAAFLLAKKDDRLGFNLYLGGKNSNLAQDVGIFVQKEEVVPLFEAVANTYLRYGLRQKRTKARLFHLLEAIGVEEFKEKLKEFYPKELEKSGRLLVAKEKIMEYKELRNGTLGYRYQTKFGEVSVEELDSLLRLAQDHGASIRFGVDQNIYLLGLSSTLSSSPYPSSSMLVCAGSRYCIYSLFDTKQEAEALQKKISHYDIRIGYSGCLKGCGRHIIADIGLVGIRTNNFGQVERGVRFFLGALYTSKRAEARLIFWAVPLRRLKEVIDLVIGEFEDSGFVDFEHFSEHILFGYEPEFLAWYILAKLDGKQLPPLGEIAPKAISHEELKELEAHVFGS